MTMHASIWRFEGDPDTLLAAYDAVIAAIGPANLTVHLCLRGQDGIVMVDTCPSEEAFHDFMASAWFRELRGQHGLPDPVAVEHHPVHLALGGRAAAVA